MQADYTKDFPFHSPSYIFSTVNLLFSFLLKRGVAIICYLPLVNSWVQGRSQCASQRHLLSTSYSLSFDFVACNRMVSLQLLSSYGIFFPSVVNGTKVNPSQFAIL
jgi:hypothetical protein